MPAKRYRNRIEDDSPLCEVGASVECLHVADEGYTCSVCKQAVCARCLGADEAYCLECETEKHNAKD